jgi:HEAT repeat protein
MIKPFSIALFSLCLTLAVPVQAMPEGDMAPNDKQLAELYWQGQESLKKSDWSAARERFRRLETELRKKEPESVDAAVYWQAYALVQARRNAEARTTLERLQRDFPGSRWKKDADSLMRQIEPEAGKTAAAGAEDDGLAEMAVTGLMQAPPERAIPILRKVLDGSHELKVKKRALFVLSQLDDAAAQEMLGEIASSSREPELRQEAIRMLGISGEDKSIDRLRSIYAASKNVEEKQSVIQAWLIADRPQLVMQAARTETDEELRKSAVHALGAMNARTELQALFDADKSVEGRKAILQSMGIAGDSETLAKISTSNQPEPIRVEAIHALGIAGNGEAGALLTKIYSSAGSDAIRDAALNGMLISGESDAMLKLYREARNKEEKQKLLRMLTLTNSDATLDLIEAELDKGDKQK